MFKGIISLFTSGAILNPMVLSGIIVGFYCVFTLEDTEIFSFFKNNIFYVYGMCGAFIYNILFKKVYNNNGKGIDYSDMSFNIIFSFIKFVISAILSVSFIWMISF